jgi:16S rRNA (cytosine967-C5)-methyltransferase
MPVISPARKAAFQILMTVERGQAHSDDLLRGTSVNALSSPDRNLTTVLVLGTLRWQIRLDDQIQALLKHPGARLDLEVQIALRLGAFQLLHLDRIPARAAIDESVELTKQAGHRFASGMVNAVLRKLSNAPPANSSEVCPADLALAQAHPSWMVERWVGFYGTEAAKAICGHGQSQPALTLRIEDPAVAEELIAEGIELQSSELLSVARRVVSGDVTGSAAFQEGRLRLQDEGSQLIAELAGHCFEHPDQKEKIILDACAAPGGKTLILAERNPDARIVACESNAKRTEQLRLRLGPLAERIECRQIDVATLGEESAFDLALADVPCSGTGTLGRNPEIRHRFRFEDLTRHAERQRAILRAALRAVRPGGRVVYSTCSLELEENEQVVAAVLAEAPNARQISLESCIATLANKGILILLAADRLKAALTPEGALRLLPGAFHTDGFFVALIERIS